MRAAQLLNSPPSSRIVRTPQLIAFPHDAVAGRILFPNSLAVQQYARILISPLLCCSHKCGDFFRGDCDINLQLVLPSYFSSSPSARSSSTGTLK
uniref:Uncharacterized protein n=1 Tax=Siphoviridae sp. ctFBb37 TaxID=2827565 RepID=A0A8S5RSP4_9CAUD|nr:MAG TPA: hypothetical protein [Siphoviridae sp. ctFBb37]